MQSNFPIRDEPLKEDDVTKRFVMFMQSLEWQDNDTFIRLLNHLCHGTGVPAFSAKEKPVIKPFYQFQGGELDIAIVSPNIFCAVEVKFWSQPKELQKKKYTAFLNGSAETKSYLFKKLIFLTPNLLKEDHRIYANPRWVHVLRFLETNTRGNILISEFAEFLKEIGGDDQEPNSKIIDFIGLATKQVWANGVGRKIRAGGEHKYAPYTGFYISNERPKELWCGITHNFPSQIRFNTEKGAGFKYKYSDVTRARVKTSLPCFKENYFITKFGPQMDEPGTWGLISFLFHMDQTFRSHNATTQQDDIYEFLKCASGGIKYFRNPNE